MSFVDLSTPVNSTKVTMNERFSSLPQQITLAGPSHAQMGALSLRPASARNRQLADLLEQRTSELLIQEALNLQKGLGRNIQRRLGLDGFGARSLRPVVTRLGGGISARLGNAGLVQRQAAGRGRGRRRGRGGPIALQRSGLRRSNSVQSLRRSASVQSLNNVGRESRSRSRSRLRMDQPQLQSVSLARARSRSRSRGNLNAPQVRRGRSRSRGGNVAGGVTQRVGLRNRSRGRTQLQPIGGGVNGRGRGRGRSRSIPRKAGGPPNPGARGRRGRGARRGRGGPGRGGRAPVPSKDDLDKQIDQYMASQSTPAAEDWDMKM